MCMKWMFVFVIFRNLEVLKELVVVVKEVDILVLCLWFKMICLFVYIMNYLESRFVLVILMYGVLVDIYGLGVLIMGSSGVGKSEIVLEFVKCGYRFVVDDNVEIC